MPKPPKRRVFLASLAVPFVPGALGTASEPKPTPARWAKIKLSCNLYSFNGPLRSGEMTLEQAIDFCAELGFDAVDPTGYYFPGHPAPPTDAYVHALKRRAFLNGLGVSGTGVRNDFTRARRRRARGGRGAREALGRGGGEAGGAGAAGLRRSRRW